MVHQGWRWLKLSVKLIAGLVSLLFMAWVAWAWASRIDVPPPTRLELSQSLSGALRWISDHEAQVMDDDNSALWWMMRQSAEKSRDPYLTALYARHLAKIRAQPTMWSRVVDPRISAWINVSDAAQSEPYQQFILYGATCDDELAELPGVKRNQSRWLCKWALPWAMLRDPTCSTHQMMGVALIKERRCPAKFDVDGLEKQLRSDIDQQLIADPRVRDAYLQRLLFQAWSGGVKAVDQAALARALKQQSSDGGWSNQQVLWDGGSGRILGFSEHAVPLLTMERSPTTFHATAQGLLLMVLMLNP